MENPKSLDSASRKPIKCAIYARCASDVAHSTSIAEQIQRCTDYAERNNWKVIPEFVKSEVAFSGVCLDGRKALRSLMRDVEQRPRPVDRLLIDDNSRLARNVVDILHITKHFNKSGVQVIAITQGLDCGSDSELQVSRLCALMDEQYRAELGRRIHRGQLGRVLNGYISGGRCYGYRNVPIDLTGGHDRATPLVLAVRREIAREQAAVVRRIFAQRANGHSFSKIADALNAELVPYPRHNNSSRSRWCSSTIQSILRNEHYRGVITWNRTRKTRSPETLEYKRTFRPEAEWVRIDCPECRIISEEMWERVRAKRRMHASPKRSRLNDKRLRERS